MAVREQLQERTGVSSDLLLRSNTRRLSPPGLGDMAVSNTIGSNVFDILVGLGIPWGLQTMVINHGSTVSSSRLLSQRDGCREWALYGRDGGIGPAPPRAAGDTLPTSPWLPGTHSPRRLPEELGVGGGLPREAQARPAPTGTYTPRLRSLSCPSPPGPFLQISRVQGRGPPRPHAGRGHTVCFDQGAPGSPHGRGLGSPAVQGACVCLSR